MTRVFIKYCGFLSSKNSRKFVTSPSPAHGCYWLYKKLPAVNCEKTQFFWTPCPHPHLFLTALLTHAPSYALLTSIEPPIIYSHIISRCVHSISITDLFPLSLPHILTQNSGSMTRLQHDFGTPGLMSNFHVLRRVESVKIAAFSALVSTRSGINLFQDRKAKPPVRPHDRLASGSPPDKGDNFSLLLLAIQFDLCYSALYHKSDLR